MLGKIPFSTYLTQVRFTVSGTWFSVLQATVQAWQPMHLRLSITKPYRMRKAFRGPIETRRGLGIVAERVAGMSDWLEATVGNQFACLSINLGYNSGAFLEHPSTRTL
jgi:hypothetical protein